MRGGHSGLSAPVPRGKKSKKMKTARGTLPEGAGMWINEEKFDADTFLDKSYRRHLERHSNKYLLRIRMLYYIQHEILGDHLDKIDVPTPVVDLNFVTPPCEGAPSHWWDEEADRSLLVGTYRHGFERYNMMRLDPGLCFLARCGPPDNAAVQVITSPPPSLSRKLSFIAISILLTAQTVEVS